MEIKHTLEILTKDIQDIEKLVGNLQNSQDGSAIELDLALSKLRNVYEILTMIKTDRLRGLLNPEVAEPEVIPEPEPVVVAEPEPVVVAEPEQVVVAEPEPAPVPEVEAEALLEPEPEPDLVAEPAPKKPKNAEIIAEKFSGKSSINEDLGGQREKELDAKLFGKPIDQISRNIGINDRFLIIKELFEGNSDEFGKLITGLDGAENYEEALELLNSRFADSMDHEGVDILAGLVKRRFLQV